MWDIGWLVPGQGTFLPAGVEDDRPGIWISYVPVAEVEADIRNLVRLRDHKLVALSEYEWEALKIGAGPPPVRVDEGWLLIHHGVTGTLEPGTDQQQNVHYEAGALLLDRDDPSRVLARTAEPLLSPETPEELVGHRAERGLPDRDRGDRGRAVRLLRDGRHLDRSGTHRPLVIRSQGAPMEGAPGPRERAEPTSTV